MIPYAKQSLSKNDIKSVIKALKSDYLTQGPLVDSFEETLAAYCGAQFGVAVNSATSALHIACMALDLGPGDWLWTSPNSFVASANCAIYCGAKIDFVDIDPKSCNMSAEKLEEKLILSEKIGNLPKVVIPVHFAGQSCEMQKIHRLSVKYGFKIIEDASHAFGGKYQNLTIGNCLYSDITVFSFHPVKIITTGEGGMATTNNPDLAEKMLSLRSHGIKTVKNKIELLHPYEIWNYHQLELGFNYRLTDIQAALGLSQLKKINYFMKKRSQIVRRYNLNFAELPIELPWTHPDSTSSNHLYVIHLDKNLQKKLYLYLHRNNIKANLHYIPIHLHPFFRQIGFKPGDFPEAEKHFRTAISLPIYAKLTYGQQKKVIKSLKVFFEKNNLKYH
jgi:UDP-4-amino-4,6-dideoxy-N-acetyl-beta-L-altrosamine transaminase